MLVAPSRSPPRAHAAAMLVAASLAAACGGPTYVFDGRAIAIERGPTGELVAAASASDGRERPPASADAVLLDTGSSLTLWSTPGGGQPAYVDLHTLSLLAPRPDGSWAVRAVLSDLPAVGVPLRPLDGGRSVTAVLGGDTLAALSLELAFGATASLRLWDRQPAADAFLSEWGYAVLHVPRYGGGQTDARGRPDFIGLRGPYEFPATRLVARACAAPAPFTSSDALPARCCPGDERTLATGVDLALVVGTGFGRTVLARSAWERVRATLGAVVAEASGSVAHPSFAAPVPASIVTLDRLALVDQEASDFDDPGPCVELGRARRLEQIAVLQQRASLTDAPAACAQPCDQDSRTPGAPKPARNSAGYVELGGPIEIAVVDDTAPFLQAMRAEVRPEGPEVDGVLGAGALGGTRVEIVYRESPARLVFSCLAEGVAGDASGTRTCRAVGRCPRLPERGAVHTCFGLPAHTLPRMCDNLEQTCR